MPLRAAKAAWPRTVPLVVETGKHTGRSAKDKFIVRDAETENTVWWGKTNVAMTPEHFAALKTRLLQGAG